jgi:hypothetical protein
MIYVDFQAFLFVGKSIFMHQKARRWRQFGDIFLA